MSSGDERTPPRAHPLSGSGGPPLSSGAPSQEVLTRGPSPRAGVLSSPLDIAADSARAGLTKGGFLGQPRIAVAVVAAGLAYSGCGGCGGTVV